MKTDKLQANVAFLGARATEGRSLVAPTQPFGAPHQSAAGSPSAADDAWDALGGGMQLNFTVHLPVHFHDVANIGSCT